MIPESHFLMLGAALFSIGVFGVFTRRNAIGILMSIELILNAANINLITFSKFSASPDGLADFCPFCDSDSSCVGCCGTLSGYIDI